MECLYFHTTREFNNDQLIDAFRTVAFIEKVVWVESMIDHPNTGPLDNTTLYAEGKMGTGQFGFSYVAYLFHQPAPLTKTKLVGVMQRLAKQVPLQALVDDGGINPYVFISIDETGFATLVGVKPEPYNDTGELTIEGPYESSFGCFALTNPLVENEVQVISSQLDKYLSDHELEAIDEQLFDHDFRNFKNTRPDLQLYHQIYLILPKGKNKWISNDEKSIIFTDIMISFQRQTGTDVCIFPRNSETIENIPGGSDSERFCVNITGHGVEKIIYKPRRKSWLTP